MEIQIPHGWWPSYAENASLLLFEPADADTFPFSNEYRTANTCLGTNLDHSHHTQDYEPSNDFAPATSPWIDPSSSSRIPFQASLTGPSGHANTMTMQTRGSLAAPAYSHGINHGAGQDIISSPSSSESNADAKHDPSGSSPGTRAACCAPASAHDRKDEHGDEIRLRPSQMQELAQGRPFTCRRADCKHYGFGFTTRNDLARHEWDLHHLFPRSGKAQCWKCAKPSCQRTKKLWRRYDNFRQHVKKVHPGCDNDEFMERCTQTYTRTDEGVEVETVEGMDFYDGEWLTSAMVNDNDQQWKPGIAPAWLSPAAASSKSPSPRLMASVADQAISSHHSSTSSTPGSRGKRRSMSRRSPEVHKHTERSKFGPPESFNMGVARPCTLPPDSGPREHSSRESHGSEHRDIVDLATRLYQQEQSVDNFKAKLGQLIDGLPGDSKTDALAGSSGARRHPYKIPGTTSARTTRPNMLTSRRPPGLMEAAVTASQQAYTCPWSHCRSSFGTSAGLEKHKRRHWRPYACTHEDCPCSKTFGSVHDWKRHETSQHQEAVYWRCAACAVLFDSERSFATHLKGQHDVPMAFLPQHILASHVDIATTGQFWCGFCANIRKVNVRGSEASQERFTHIAHHFHPEQRRIQDWLLPWRDCLKTELAMTDTGTALSTVESSRQDELEIEATGEGDPEMVTDCNGRRFDTAEEGRAIDRS